MNTFTDIGVKVILISFVLALLPASPFAGFSYLLSNIPYLSFVNWFVPIQEILVVLEGWLVVVSAYYSILYIVNYVGLVKN